jgi:hypothetical protein
MCVIDNVIAALLTMLPMLRAISAIAVSAEEGHGVAKNERLALSTECHTALDDIKPAQVPVGRGILSLSRCNCPSARSPLVISSY